MYGVARVAVTARQRDSLSSQQGARWPAERRVMPSRPAVTVHTGWQRPTIHADVDARVALPPAGQLRNACASRGAVDERQWRAEQRLLRRCSGALALRREAALTGRGRCQKFVWTAEALKPGGTYAPAPQLYGAHATEGRSPRKKKWQRPQSSQVDSFQEYRTSHRQGRGEVSDCPCLS